MEKKLSNQYKGRYILFQLSSFSPHSYLKNSMFLSQGAKEGKNEGSHLVWWTQ